MTTARQRPEPLPRFRTLGGAEVHIIAHRHGEAVGHAWVCQGCDATGARDEWDGPEQHPADLPIVRRKANKHAGICRSIPRGTVSR